MLMNFRNALMAGKRTPTAKDYNYDLALWDGIENAGYGVHDASATSITNLLGGGLDIALSGNYTVNADNIRFNGGYGTADRYDFTGCNGATISVLASYDNATAWNGSGWSYAGRGVARLATYYENGQWKFSAFSSEVPLGVRDSMVANTILKLDFVWNAITGYCLLYKNGSYVGAVTYNWSLGSNVNRFRVMAYGSGTDTNYQTYKGNIYNLAVSTRALTTSEISANYAIDKARFGLP